MGKVRCRNPKTGVVYVYSSEGYFDEKDQKYKYKRRVIGKLDENGNEIPTGPKGRPRKTYGESDELSMQTRPQGESGKDEETYAAVMSRMKELEEKNLTLQNELAKNTDELLRLKKDVNRFSRQIREAINTLDKAVSKS